MTLLADFVANGPLLVDTVPTEKAQEIIYVRGMGLLEWTTVAGVGAFTGYRSPDVGRLVFGTTTTPRVCELDIIGGLAPKAAYASLWAGAQQQGHVVTVAAWTTKVFKFADVDDNYFRLPDLRDMSPRFTGTNADTSAARLIGSYQADAFKAHTHGLPYGETNGSVNASLGLTNTPLATGNTNPTGATETRPANTAFAPRIRI